MGTAILARPSSLWCVVRCWVARAALAALAEGGRHDGTRSVQARGFTHGTPCAATLPTILRHVHREECEAPLGPWADRVVGSLPAAPGTPGPAVALDGKRSAVPKNKGLRGHPGARRWRPRWAGHGPNTPWTTKPMASTAVETLCPHGVLDGRMGTLDALLTQRHVAQTMGDQGGDEGRSGKEPQPQRRAAIALVLTRPPVGDRQATARTIDMGHGRSEQRHLMTREALMGDSDGPGLAPGCELGRHGILHKTGEERGEGVSGITSLRPERATLGRVLELVRGHGQREHTSHGVRDVPFDADCSPVGCGNMPHVMAALRNPAMGLRWPNPSICVTRSGQKWPTQ